MKKLIYIFIIFIFQIQLYSSIKVDLLQYNYKDGKTLLEFNYQIPTGDLKFNLKPDSTFVAEIEVNFKVSSVGITSIDESWTFNYKKNDNDPDLIIFDKKYFILYPGQYEYELSSNILSEDTEPFKGNILINKYDSNSLNVSDILLAHQIQEFDSTLHQSKFRKNNLYVIPNVEHTISGAYTQLKYYYEIYNIDIEKINKIDILYTIITGDNKEVFKFKRAKTVKNKSIYDFGFFPIDSLDNGVYKLFIEISHKDIILQSQKTKFYILDPEKDFHITDKYVENITFERSPFAMMTEQKVKYEFETMKIILTDYEVEKFELLNTTRAKQRALFEYWKERDTDPQTPVNEYLTEYKSRIEYADKYFSRGDIISGWKTERGRVLLKYGFPTNREVFRAQNGKKAAEEWQYDELYGGSYFFFVDRFGDNSFLLVHTTVPNGVKNFNWFDEFNPAIENDGSPKYNNSRNDDRR